MRKYRLHSEYGCLLLERWSWDHWPFCGWHHVKTFGYVPTDEEVKAAIAKEEAVQRCEDRTKSQRKRTFHVSWVRHHKEYDGLLTLAPAELEITEPKGNVTL